MKQIMRLVGIVAVVLVTGCATIMQEIPEEQRNKPVLDWHNAGTPEASEYIHAVAKQISHIVRSGLVTTASSTAPADPWADIEVTLYGSVIQAKVLEFEGDEFYAAEAKYLVEKASRKAWRGDTLLTLNTRFVVNVKFQREDSHGGAILTSIY